MTKKALIVFAKNPILGKVKTRLAKEVGNDRALELYKTLMEITYRQTKDIDCSKFLFLSPNIDNDLFDQDYIQMLQTGNDLGERMSNAFNYIFAKDYNKIIIVGSDCPQLTPEILNEAFEKLYHFDFVIGPAEDGGYYLIGMKEQCNILFNGMDWGSKNVLSETIRRLKENNLNFYLLQQLSDVDELKDLVKLL